MLCYYILQTNLPLRPQLLYAARGFVLDKVPLAWEGWHNHELATGRNIHRYPAVQYKLWNHRLAIVALASEKSALFELAKAFPLEGTLNGRPLRVKLQRIERCEHRWQLQPPRWYACSNFLPMKTEQYEAFRSLCARLGLPTDASSIAHPEQLAFVEQLLQQRVREQLDSLGAPLDAALVRVQLATQPIRHRTARYYRQTRFSKFSELCFSLNLDWPLALGLGFGTALGFGMLRRLKQIPPAPAIRPSAYEDF